ncbi:MULTISPECIES: hypothetical protein [unclassified Streptomyces]|uniref:hypothetical protein n=1 Tax=unclassified Streptomyces TaxID=2593676 RepID=UPI0004BF699B|nr:MULTISPECIES: hypothetical protein [unclassified Streptomyces]
MSADEARDIAAPPRTGPRHAAPRKPLFTRFHVPAGKAIALAAMPTAVLMGMGLTPTLATADDHASSSKTLSAEEYQDCVDALASASASPSASESSKDKSKDKDDEDTDTESGKADEKTGSSSSDDSKGSSGSSDASDGKDSTGTSGSGSSSSTSKSGSDSSSSSSSSDSGSEDKGAGDDKSEPSASPSASASGGGGLLQGIGDALKDILTPGDDTKDSGDTSSATPAPSASKTADDAAAKAKETTKKVTDTAGDAAKDVTDTATGAAGDAARKATEKAKDAAEEATSSPSPSSSADPSPSASASDGTDPDDCPAATDAEGGVDNQVLLPDDPWHLQASSLTLKGADYKGIVEVRTADGTTKKVLKYVISAGTDIGDLHQTVVDKRTGTTHHVQAAKGSTSTITDGDTVMYTESISGNLLGLIPITFDPEHPPPLNIPLIYFTHVEVVQAGQFGGTLHIPGLHQYTTDS